MKMDARCAICLLPLSDDINNTLQCQHTYHKECEEQVDLNMYFCPLVQRT